MDPKPDFKRVKVEKISLLALFADRVLFRPPRGETWWVTGAVVKRRALAGVVTDDPQITLSTADGLLVTGVDIVNTEDFTRLLTDGDNEITYDKPLLMSVTDAPAGATTWDVDVIVFLARISD